MHIMYVVAEVSENGQEVWGQLPGYMHIWWVAGGRAGVCNRGPAVLLMQGPSCCRGCLVMPMTR